MEFEALIFYFLSVAVPFYPIWKIIERAGLNRLMALLLLIPSLGFFIILIYLAFYQWPLSKQNR